MSDEILSLIMRARDEMSGAVNKASGSLDRLGKSGSTANSILSGIGAGIGIAGVMGVSNAVSTLTNVLGDAVAAAREDEVSVRQLATALRDNVPAWDGQTGAIERTILKRQRLGFEDTALRGSLATLSAATHDVSRALELQSLAMDISRFRGIDLASASDMVAKATSGSLKALNAAIPATRGAASAQDALTIAIRATSGQADAYADTSLGKMEAASIRVGESLERLGYRILPAVADAADLAAGGIDLLTTAIDGLTVPLQTADEKSWDTGEAVHTVGYQAGWAAAQVNALIAPAAAAAAQLDSLSGSAINLKYAAINAGGAIVGLASANAALGNWTGYTTNAQTGFRFTQQQVNQAIVDGANAHQDYLATLNRTPATVGAVSARSTAALDRMIERLRALDAAQQVVFERMIRNLTTVVDKQLEAIDAAQAHQY